METNTSRGDELLTPEQVAARLGVSREVVLQLVAREQLTAYRIGRSLRFASDAVADYLNQHLLAESAWRRWPQAHDLLPASASAGATELVNALEETAVLPGAGAQAERLRIGLAPLVREHYSDFPPRLRDLEQLAASAATASTLEQFAADLVLDPPSSSSDLAGPPHLDDDYLILSTLHSAKGLEWEIVQLLHLSDGNIPSDMALTNPEGLEEERRLLLRRGHPSPQEPAHVRATPLLPPTPRSNRHARARHHLTLPHRRPPATLSTHPARRSEQVEAAKPELAASISCLRRRPVAIDAITIRPLLPRGGGRPISLLKNDRRPTVSVVRTAYACVA